MRWLFLIGVACAACLATPAFGAAEAPAVIYGVEIDVRGDRERVLVFASQPVEPRTTS